MSNPRRTLAFVLAASDHGTMIVNRVDYAGQDGGHYGVGFQVLDRGSHDKNEVDQVLALLSLRRQRCGDGVVAIDCGANIGVHTVEWAKLMTGWGEVISIEAQERLFYALAGNVAINNCFNARVINAAVTAKPGSIRVPVPDYRIPGSFGSLELRLSSNTEFIGQMVDYSEAATAAVAGITVDSLNLSRLDLIKVDVEGMEDEVLAGARESIAAFHPIIVAEHIKVGWTTLAERLAPAGYSLFNAGMNLVAVHNADPCRDSISAG